MKGSEFAAKYGAKGATAWEAAALEMARAGNIVSWPMKTISYDLDGHRVRVDVASDYFAVGDADDFLRMPLQPVTAQKVANLWGFFLPTPRVALETWRAAEVRLKPISGSEMSAKKNMYASMAQFYEHNALVNSQLQGTPSSALRAGHKKDIVVGNIYKPGRVLIYGWPRAGYDIPAKDTAPSMTVDWRIQPYSNIHGEGYFDYSHGARWMGTTVEIDGETLETEKVLTDSKLSRFLSDEGPLKNPRYPGAGTPKPSALAGFFTPTVPSYAAYGLRLVRDGHVT